MDATLYQLEACPFCRKVRAKLEQKKIPFKIVNVEHDRDDKTRQMIAQRSGVATVPVVDFDDSWVGDSGNIIDFIDEHF